MVERPWRTITIALFAALLVLQGYYSFAVKPEPYPTIRMPNFGTAASEDGTFNIILTRAEVVNKDGSTQSVSPTELMSDFRFSTARPSYDYLFLRSDPSAITPSVKAWLSDRLAAMGVRGHPTEIRLCWQETVVSVSDASRVRDKPCMWRVIAL